MTEPTDIATLLPADRAIIVLGSIKTETQLLEMVQEASAITEVSDPAARAQAHGVAMKLKNARTTIEKTGKAARDDANAFNKAVITEEKRLIAITESEEKRVLGLRDAYDAQIEAEKQAKAAIEASRVAAIKEKIAGINALPLALNSCTSAEIAAEYAALEAFVPVPEVFFEFTEECIAACQECLATLAGMYDRVLAQETAAAEAEAERQRLEEATRVEREALERQRAEMDAQRAEMEAQRVALAQERAELEALRAQAAQPVVQSGAEIEPESALEPGNVIVTHPNGAPMYSTTTFKDNGQPIMLDADGKRSIFCDIANDMDDVMPVVEITADEAADLFNESADPTIVPWHIRQTAIHTAAQFTALAGKVEQCGFADFADQLRLVGERILSGAHDDAIGNADLDALIAADTLLIDATVNCIDALTVGEAPN